MNPHSLVINSLSFGSKSVILVFFVKGWVISSLSFGSKSISVVLFVKDRVSIMPYDGSKGISSNMLPEWAESDCTSILLCFKYVAYEIKIQF